MAHEFDGQKYARASAHQREWGAKIIAELALKGNERVLDLGCGDGTNTARMAALLPKGHVVGIDASKGMIAAAAPKTRKNLTFMLMDIDSMTFENRFDVIFSNATLHWVQDHQRLLNNAHKALKQGGCLRFNFAGDGNCAHFFKVVRQAMALDEFVFFFKEFAWPWYMPSLEQYRRLAANSDLKEVKVWGENADRFFPDAETLTGWIDQPSLVPFLACVPDTHKSAFRRYVIEEMVRETRQDSGRCFETFRRINLFARK